jgi:hypothetical protein
MYVVNGYHRGNPKERRWRLKEARWNLPPGSVPWCPAAPDLSHSAVTPMRADAFAGKIKSGR